MEQRSFKASRILSLPCQRRRRRGTCLEVAFNLSVALTSVGEWTSISLPSLVDVRWEKTARPVKKEREGGGRKEFYSSGGRGREKENYAADGCHRSPKVREREREIMTAVERRSLCVREQ